MHVLSMYIFMYYLFLELILISEKVSWIFKTRKGCRLYCIYETAFMDMNRTEAIVLKLYAQIL
jgi:hypothetical protein